MTGNRIHTAQRQVSAETSARISLSGGRTDCLDCFGAGLKPSGEGPVRLRRRKEAWSGVASVEPDHYFADRQPFREASSTVAASDPIRLAKLAPITHSIHGQRSLAWLTPGGWASADVSRLLRVSHQRCLRTPIASERFHDHKHHDSDHHQGRDFVEDAVVARRPRVAVFREFPEAAHIDPVDGREGDHEGELGMEPA